MQDTKGEVDGDLPLHSALHTYVMSCYGRLSAEQKKALSVYIEGQAKKIGSESLAEQWGLSTDEVRLFKRVVDA